MIYSFLRWATFYMQLNGWNTGTWNQEDLRILPQADMAVFDYEGVTCLPLSFLICKTGIIIVPTSQD